VREIQFKYHNEAYDSLVHAAQAQSGFVRLIFQLGKNSGSKSLCRSGQGLRPDVVGQYSKAIFGQLRRRGVSAASAMLTTGRS
jgi:hypothetical protein